MKEALKLALEALETCCAGDYSTGHVIDPSFDEDAVNEAITAIKEALAQDELCSSQEPVAFISPGGHIHYDPYLDSVPLYTTPPKRPWGKPWVSLTDDEIRKVVGPWGDMPIKGYTRQLVDKFEAALKEKNT